MRLDTPGGASESLVIRGLCNFASFGSSHRCEHGGVVHAEKLARLGARILETSSQEFDDRVACEHDARRSRWAERGSEEHTVFSRELPDIVEYF